MIRDDNTLEGPETFFVLLSIGSDSDGVVRGYPNVTEVTILSEDSE